MILLKNYNHSEKLKVIDASDRCHIYIDEKLVATQYKEEIGTEEPTSIEEVVAEETETVEE